MLVPERLPPNDGGISYGQAAIAASRRILRLRPRVARVETAVREESREAVRVFWRALAVSVMVLGAMASTAAAARTTSFDADWRFALVNREAATDPTGAYEHAADPGYDDSSWRQLDLPHDWSIELLPTPTGGTTAGTGFFQGGLGWYRKTFTLPRSLRGKRISVEFDGVYMDSEVYFNGRKVASHPYGYTGFEADLTGVGAARTAGRRTCSR